MLPDVKIIKIATAVESRSNNINYLTNNTMKSINRLHGAITSLQDEGKSIPSFRNQTTKPLAQCLFWFINLLKYNVTENPFIKLNKK